jgi:hypothetical protein
MQISAATTDKMPMRKHPIIILFTNTRRNVDPKYPLTVRDGFGRLIRIDTRSETSTIQTEEAA